MRLFFPFFLSLLFFKFQPLHYFSWQVQKAINALMKSRTTLVVAHRLSTVRSADQIVVIADHAVSAVGTHEVLMQTSAIYADLVKRQLSAGMDKPPPASPADPAAVLKRAPAAGGEPSAAL